MKKCIANDIVIIASGCSAQAAAKAGLMDKSARELCGAGLKRVCELADIPPVLHMGSCVDISRMMLLAAELAKDSGLQINTKECINTSSYYVVTDRYSFFRHPLRRSLHSRNRY